MYPAFMTSGEMQTLAPTAMLSCPGMNSAGAIGNVAPPMVTQPETPPSACWNDVTVPQTFEAPPGLLATELGAVNCPLTSRIPCRHRFDPLDTVPRLTPAPMV